MSKAQPLFSALAVGLLLVLVAGCGKTFRNYTERSIAQNPSGLYTFSFAAQLPNENVVPGSENAQIVINGQTHAMERSLEGERIFSYDFRMPPGQNQVSYYYVFRYQVDHRGNIKDRVMYSTEENGSPYTARLINRWVSQMNPQRSPVGHEVVLFGNGFVPGDTVILGDTPVPTTVEGENLIRFQVPALAANRSYQVYLRSGVGDLPVDQFRVDESRLTVLPEELQMTPGEVVPMVFEIEQPAPDGGLFIDVKTDIPDSIIMREVTIPAGARSVNVNVEAGEAAQGTLHFEARGFTQSQVPVDIR